MIASTRTLLFGGFSRSGHDSLISALQEGFGNSDCRPAELRWRDIIPGVENHPLFSLHRGGYNPDAMSAFMDKIEIPRLLAVDLFPITGFLSDFDLVVSVHPWTSFVIAESALRRGLNDLVIVDVAADYCSVPVVEHERINLYVGGIGARPVSARVRARISPTGVPARSTFALPDKRIEGRLFVSAGRTGYAQRAAIAGLQAALPAIGPTEVIVAVSGNYQYRGKLEKLVGSAKLALLPDVRDPAPWARTSEWILTKGSGAAVAEALATGAVVVTYDTGVFWEDEAARYLHSVGATLSVNALAKVPTLRPWDGAAWAQQARGATTATIAAIRHRATGGRSANLAARPKVHIEPTETQFLPEISAWMAEALPDWLEM